VRLIKLSERLILGPASHWPERFTLSSLDLRGVSATAALQVEVLTNCVVKQAHWDKAYWAATTFAAVY
jgi:hypothetical protein